MNEILSQLDKDDLLDLALVRHVPVDTANVLVHAKAKWIDQFIDGRESDVNFMYPPDGKDKDSGGGLWKVFLNEMHILLCTKDKKYSALRKEVNQLKGKPAGTIVSLISASIANFCNIEAGLLVPFIALMLSGVSSVGCGVFCSTMISNLEEK